MARWDGRLWAGWARCGLSLNTSRCDHGRVGDVAVRAHGALPATILLGEGTHELKYERLWTPSAPGEQALLMLR
jgi:hypothetical protein